MNTLSQLSNNRYAANIPKYYLYSMLNGFGIGLVMATWVIYLHEARGLSLTQVTIVDVFFWITMAFSEVPTGVIADGFGRKLSLAIGLILISLGVFLWGLASTVLTIALTYVMAAVGFTFLSGAQDAFLFESLNLMGCANQYTKVAGRIGALTLSATAIGSVIGGLLASADLVFPFYVSALTHLVALGVVLTFKESSGPKLDKEKSNNSYKATVRDAIYVIRSRTTLRFALFYLVAVAAAFYVIEGLFIQPQAVALGFPVAAIGMIVMFVQVASVAGSTSAYRVSALFGERNVLNSIPILIIVNLILLAVFQVMPNLLFIGMMGFLVSASRPLLMNMIQNEVGDNIRATVLSLQSVIFTLLLVFGEPILGYVADSFGLPAVYIVISSTLAVGFGLIFWISRQKLPNGIRRTIELGDNDHR